MDDLIKLCDELEKCKQKRSCYANEIICTKAKLECYIDGDENKILKLKAQIKKYDSYSHDDTGFISMIISGATLCLTVFGGLKAEKAEYAILGLLYLIIIVILLMVLSWGKNKYGYRNKWIRNIQVVLEDLSKE